MTGVIHIAVAMKPNDGNFVENALKHGVAGLNIDGGRVSTDDKLQGGAGGLLSNVRDNKSYPDRNGYQQPAGRWPANVILGHLLECVKKGMKMVKSNGHWIAPTGRALYDLGIKNDGRDEGNRLAKNGVESVSDWDCSGSCPVRLMDRQSGTSKSNIRIEKNQGRKDETNWRLKPTPGTIKDFGDSGGASRFFKQIGEYDEDTRS